MYLKRINSRFVDAIGYDPQALMLEIKFKISGRIYAFLEVQKDIYRSFVNSKSKGHFFNKYIKDNYKHIQLK
ncbi:MAG TPA: KTSC domain-containing protein [Cytophagaceae bacterium]